jgi:hypothetical protein
LKIYPDIKPASCILIKYLAFLNYILAFVCNPKLHFHAKKRQMQVVFAALATNRQLK